VRNVFEEYADSTVRDFLPILVERRVATLLAQRRPSV
jgi:hypothetical protein